MQNRGGTVADPEWWQVQAGSTQAGTRCRSHQEAGNPGREACTPRHAWAVVNSRISGGDVHRINVGRLPQAGRLQAFFFPAEMNVGEWPPMVSVWHRDPVVAGRTLPKKVQV